MARRGRRNLLRARWDALRTSLWFLPAPMAAGGAGLAPLAAWIDGRLGQGPDGSFRWLVYVAEPAQARELLVALLTSTIASASLVFSITMVVLTLAESQFGPRLVRNFMGRLQTQAVLGTFVATAVYCLLLLSLIGWREGNGPFPYLSVSIAIAFALLSLWLLVLHIHTLATSIMAESLIEVVAGELDQGIAELRPLEEGDDPAEVLPPDFDERAAFSAPEEAGYVQAIEFADIVAAAREADALVGLRFRAGDYVTETGRGIGIHPGERASPELARAVARSLAVGVHRTPVQDLEFSIRHLIEIAVRALSPAINDPYTAVAVLHRLSASLSRLMAKAPPQGVFRDEEGRVRAVCPRPTYASLVNTSFDQIRQNGSDKPVVLIHLLQAVGRIAGCARTEEQREALRGQVRSVLEDAERAVENTGDLEDVRTAAREAERALEGRERSSA